MNSTINTSLSGLLNELAPRAPKASQQPQTSAQQAGQTSAQKSLSELISQPHEAQDAAQLERAVARIINRLLDGIQTQKGLASLIAQAKNSPISQNIFSDCKQLIALAKNDPAMKEIAQKLEQLLNPKGGAALEKSMANSGVFYEAKLRAALNAEVLPKSFFRLINYMKNLQSPSLKAQIFALGDEEMDAQSSLKALDGFISKLLKGGKNPTGGAKIGDTGGAESGDKSAKKPEGKGNHGAEKSSDLPGAMGKNAGKNIEGAKGLIKLFNALENAAKYAQKSPQKAELAAAAAKKQLAAQLPMLLKAAPESAGKIANILGEINRQLAAPKSPAAGGAGGAGGAGAGAGGAGAVGAQNAAQNASTPANAAASTFAKSTLAPSEAALNAARQINSSATAATLERAAAALAAGDEAAASKLLDAALNSPATAAKADAPALSAALRAGANLLRAKLEGSEEFEQAVQKRELKGLKALVKTAAADGVNLRAKADFAALSEDAKALLLKASASNDARISHLAQKALAQIEINQLISAANAEVFTHLPYDYEGLKHASVGFRADGEEKFSAQIKLEFSRLGRLNIMLALEGEKYLQINIKAENSAMAQALRQNAAELKSQLRAAGLLLGALHISRLEANEYESEQTMKMGLNLRI